ncbi:DedA family protein [Clostridium pasteurianum]|uniref:Putative membrane-associated protein n=1 Tax=Clostridium pasteurianum BC1 TaxID=86416 RepID=R4K1W0_CLOPA|nr:DedA family protein [Clostridium pasteurianum]AGK96548.1 putative membrane-associated protein [Clostridium pasteurianum BC1]
MVEHIINIIIVILDKLGYLGTFLGMLFESACIPIPSEIILPFGGYLSFKGHLNLILVIISGTLGGTVGSIIAYLIGSRGGRPLVEKYADKLHLSKEKIEKSDAMFNKYGDKIIFFSRLLPIIRTFISLPAGIAKMNFSKFVLYTVVGSAIWSAFLCYLGFIMGENWETIRSYYHYADIAMVILVIAFILYKIITRKKAVSTELSEKK